MGSANVEEDDNEDDDNDGSSTTSRECHHQYQPDRIKRNKTFYGRKKNIIKKV